MGLTLKHGRLYIFFSLQQSDSRSNVSLRKAINVLFIYRTPEAIVFKAPGKWNEVIRMLDLACREVLWQGVGSLGS